MAASDGGVLQSDPLFLGLTRPALMFGVSYTFAILNAMICMLYFIIKDTLYGFMAMPVIHGIGYIICLKEPLAIELLITKLSKCNNCKNSGYFGGANSYDLY